MHTKHKITQTDTPNILYLYEYLSYNFALTHINNHSYTKQCCITGHAKLQQTA